MQEKTNLNNKGFSLIELLISIAIAGIVIVSAFSVILYGMNRYSKSTKETKMQGEIQFTGNVISDAIKCGKQNSSRIEIIRGSAGEISEAYIYTGLNLDASGNPEYQGSELYASNQIIYYNASAKSLYIYDPGETIGNGDNDHLISKAIVSFECGYEKTKDEQTVGVNIETGDLNKEVYFHESSLIKVSIGYKVSNLERKTTNTYKIRNK